MVTGVATITTFADSKKEIALLREFSPEVDLLPDLRMLEIDINGLLDIIPFQVEYINGLIVEFESGSDNTASSESYMGAGADKEIRRTSEGLKTKTACTTPRLQQSHDTSTPSYPIAIIPHLTPSLQRFV
ncbi:hypothetical protein BLNAU_5142 [Blattamonas nauphoetae]|uniref:Uncharacterized protein n=1 Tax=Blattamonas nauphoetae TaxID=2049346 RepID=A0ABQ9Y8B7_9EUKA|nr:hypothetical protein BLNAU_5988 [Blattamonas nauphoetae]KAK2959945.1 hypothetical protein BLNAU_5142 [Blattamonas nauphoetae]